MNNYTNILITGGAGFIGSNLALGLIDAGYNVSVLDNLSTQIHGENPEENSYLYNSIKGKVNFIRGCVTNKEDLIKAIDNQDVIFHFAAETGTGQSMYEIERYNKVNSYGTALLLDLLVNHPNNVKKIILASTRAIYGEGKYKDIHENIVYPGSRNPEDIRNGFYDLIDNKNNKLVPLPTSEDSKVHPISMYGLTKAFQEKLIQQVGENNGIDYVILRFQNVYGKGQSMKNPYTGILSVFSTQIMTGKTINIFEDGNAVRDFVEIRDVVQACKKCLETDKANGKIINVGTGNPTSVLEVAESLIEAFDIKTNIEITGAYRLGDIRYNIADLTLMNECLDFIPQVSLNDGIHRFVNWAKNQNITENTGYNNSIEEMKSKGLFIEP